MSELNELRGQYRVMEEEHGYWMEEGKKWRGMAEELQTVVERLQGGEAVRPREEYKCLFEL